MANGEILYTLPLSAITPTVTGTDAGFSATAGVDGDPNTLHRYTHDDQAYTWDAGGGLTAIVCAISIHNHNIPSDAVLTYQNCDDGATWANDTIVAVSPGVDSFCLLGTSHNKRYHRVTIVLLGSQAIDIGEICLWSYGLVLSPNYSFRSPEIDRGVYQLNDGAGKISKSAVSRGFGKRLIFENWTAANCTTMKTIRDKTAICFIPDTAVNKCYHGVIIDKDIEFIPLFNGKYSFELTFYENSKRVA